jgi:hypothetical protein
MNLHSEVILNLALTSLIGLWLIWQAIKINSNIDIFQIVVNWFRDRPIILPSLFFILGASQLCSKYKCLETSERIKGKIAKK